MATFVLIHGAFGGSWSWDGVREALIEGGHRAVSPDLPGQGEDRTPLSEVTLDSYVDCVVNTIDAEAGPVLLVGHSLGGISISQAAERRPDAVRCLVYVAAFLLPDGSSPKAFWEEAGVPSPVMAHCDVSEDGVVTYHPEAIGPEIMNCAPPAPVARAMRLQRPMARRPLGRPLQLSEAGFGRVPRVYIECLQDRAVPIAFQRRMVERLPCREVITLDTDHVPQASAPGALVAALGDLAARY